MAKAQEPNEKQKRRLRPLGCFGPVTIIIIVGFVLAYQFVEPAPPDRVTIATGSEEGAYHRFAGRYREILSRHAIELEVRTTAGSLENLELLRDPTSGVDVAFVQGGVATANGPSLVGLASLYHEPLWLFGRAENAIERIPDLGGKRVAVGVEGSGTRALVLRLLADNGVEPESATLLSLGGEKAARALLGGAIDAAFFIAAPEAAFVRELLANSTVRPTSFARAEAYSRQHQFLSRITLPEGVIDLAANVPARDVILVAPAATLVAREEFHPALIDLLLQAAFEVHGGGGIFEAPGEFPSTRYVDFPLSKDAKRHFKYGPPFLQKYLPFWAATLVDRMKVMLLPLFVLLLPLVRVFPPVYRWQMRSRIYRWYRQLLAVDRRIQEGASSLDADSIRAELDRLENELVKISVPLSFADELYDVRVHLALVRDRLGKLPRS